MNALLLIPMVIGCSVPVQVIIIATGGYNSMIYLLASTRESHYHVKIIRFQNLLGSTSNPRTCIHLVMSSCKSIHMNVNRCIMV